MTTTSNEKGKKVMQVMNLRHFPDVKAFVDKKAEEQNVFPCSLNRAIFNAGLESLFGVTVKNKTIVQPPLDDASYPR